MTEMRRTGRLRGRPLAVAAAVAVIAGAAWSLLRRATGPLFDALHATDEVILLLFWDPTTETPRGSPIIEEALRDLTALGGFAILGGLILSATIFLLLLDRRRQAIFLVVTVVTGVLLTMLLKAGFDRPRPDLVPYGSHVLTASFPSGHSASAAVIYLTLASLLTPALRRRRVRVFVVAAAIVTTLAVGFSRVYLGVHWPSDVVAGWLVGGGWALGAWVVERRLQREGAIEPEPPLEA